MAPIPVDVPSRPFTFEAPRPGPNSMQRQAAPPSVSAVSYTPTVQPTTWRKTALRPVQQQASHIPPVPVSTQAMSMPPVQPIAQAPRAETCAVPQVTSRAHPLPVISQDFFSIGSTCQPQKAPVVPPPPVVAAHFDISTDAMEADQMDDLFDSLDMSSPEISTSMALPPAPAVQETTADAPVMQTAPADAPASFSFDLAALDLPFDDWMDTGDRPLLDAFADPDSWMS
ncbi:hypothetical protein K503DRAFT_631503 [Rhizopogon vinicolor AM-OR11-026]|uniref:Uncharacterized protein n=1 Tax=Rhizopogon vinicolor AM-OR11-026 TaxID=1314800 RepID=A0A1B7N620_9AGAM|nr:hypothetical protein K503DRAFT_631503 [Rhizopogon vinicolor AM-OR11-026]